VNGEELQASGIVGGGELLQTQSAEQPREDLHRKREVRAAGDPSAAVEREPTAWHDDMEVGMRQGTLRRTRAGAALHGALHPRTRR
jgi:hypothetical protein